MKSTWLWMAVVSPLALGLGCRHPAPAPYPAWTEREAPYRAVQGSGNAFDAYVLAGAQAETANPAWLKRVWFTPGMRRQVEAKLASAISRVERATAHPCRFEFRPTALGEPRPYRAGWRLLGRALAWRVEDAVALAKPDLALRRFLAATKFGFDLTGGSAEDASLGFAVIDDARTAMLPALPTLSARQLDALSSTLARLEARRPPIEQAIRNEGRNMLASVEATQRAYRTQDFKGLRKLLGPGSDAALLPLERLAEGPDRVEFFQGMADEARKEVAHVLAQAGKPRRHRIERSDGLGPRPWARLARHAFGGAAPLLAIADRSVARTRLLVLHSWALAHLRRTSRAPKALPTGRVKAIDPYTGLPLAFRSTESEFLVYAVGEDGRDDGGETDGSGIAPDLTLEPFD